MGSDVPSPYDNLLRIADVSTSADQRALAMRSFAQELDWVPSYEIKGTFGVGSIAGHLIVEHGLENAAAISFLKAPMRSSQLGAEQVRALLAVSYNNLIEWHLFVSENDVRWINNLADRTASPEADTTISLNAEDLPRVLSSSKLEELEKTSTLKRPIKPCDDAVLRVISRWKLLLKADYPDIDNRNLSALFNALIFVRGCEDRDLDRASGSTRVLLDTLGTRIREHVDVRAVLTESLSKTGITSPLAEYIQEDALEPFNAVDYATVHNLFRELYAPKDGSYEFNFALMSKHALSRIYEKYVALLRPDESVEGDAQLSLIRPLPKEINQYKLGAVYTPQFVAGFFARFIRDNLTPRSFRELRSIDPACGSGLFLRNILELQCDPFAQGVTPATIELAFSRTEGIDKDINACEATRLSLALLHLIATGSLPSADSLQITNADAIVAIMTGQLGRQKYGAVLSNPPYVKLDHMRPDDREIYKNYLGEQYAGRLDAYIPFVQLCLELAKSGGIICLVLPQTFLTATNSSSLRRQIHERFDVRCLIDLSAVPVFEKVGTYTILLILQRRDTRLGLESPAANIAQVTEGVGAALQACLDGRTLKNQYFTVFSAPQSIFRAKSWTIVSPEQLRIDERLGRLPTLSQFMTVAQGFVTGADEVFIRDRKSIPRGKEGIYIDYLPDRQIGRYSLPKRTEGVVFFPFEGERQLTEQEIESRFPNTWVYLCSKQKQLQSRKSVTGGGVPWWRPVRPRDPSTILKPKIVCPHLMLTPRFAVNPGGQLAVSHSPFIISKDAGEEQALIRVFCAVLNSTVCNWYLRTYAPKYGGGYNRLEVSLLRATPVPDLATVDAIVLSLIIDKVDALSRKFDDELDNSLDNCIGEHTGLRQQSDASYSV